MQALLYNHPNLQSERQGEKKINVLILLEAEYLLISCTVLKSIQENWKTRRNQNNEGQKCIKIPVKYK